MAAIILTWDENEDVHIVKDADGKNIVFASVVLADEFSNSHFCESAGM